MTTDQPFLVSHADIVFSLKTFAAAMLALVIALWLDLLCAYWAMADGLYHLPAACRCEQLQGALSRGGNVVQRIVGITEVHVRLSRRSGARPA